MSDDENLMGLDLDLDDESDGEFDPEFEAQVDTEEDPLVDDEEEIAEEDEEEPQERTPKRPATGEAEFDDEVDPDNLEDDLNTILRDRIAAGDDLAGADDAEETESGQPAEMLGTVTPRRDDEWLCEGCFLLVSKSQLGSRTDPRCPSGEEICPSLDRLGP